MSEVLEIKNFEISSECSCVEFDEDENESQSSECWGCFDDDLSNFRYEILNPWLEANGWDEDTIILVQGLGMHWNHVAGWTNARASEVVDALKLNGDFTLRYKLEGKTLTCVRSSHDELGAEFTFTYANENEE
jgi:hypothetical protein